MDNFFKPKKKGKGLKNPFAPKPNFGGGQSLGGSHPGRVLSISLSDPGPLGMKVERRNTSSKSAIIAMVVPGSQAEAAGLKRGDVCCHAGSDGQEEIMYEQFLQMAANSKRPCVFEVRRLEEKKKKDPSNTQKSTADAESRKHAMVAAAEKRANKTNKPPKKKDALPTITSTAERRRLEQEREERLKEAQQQEPMSPEAKKAIDLAKKQEEALSAQLGYNPYETNKVSSGQGRTAAVAMTHGAIQAGSDNKAKTAPPAVASPSSTPAANDNSNDSPPVSDDFDNAFTTLVTTNSHNDVVSSLSIMRKLIVNATTKGQVSEDAGKFRRVRLGNDKIRAAVTDMNGGFELMQSVGFQLVEEDGEVFLVFVYPSTGPAWLSRALQSMEQYETS